MNPTKFFPLISIFIFLIFLNNNSVIFVSAVEEEGEGIDFDYVGTKGPAFWHLLPGSDKVCFEGKRQSPINLESNKDTIAAPSKSDFNDAKDVEIFNTGNTVEISTGKNITLPVTVVDDGSTYELEQFHFHTPSEHRVDGVHHDVEQHLVFKRVNGKNPNEILVVAVFYDIGKVGNTFLDPVIENIPKKVNEKKPIDKVELSKLFTDINNIKNAFNYAGSLTTPPCTESVVWYVNEKPLAISADQFSTLRGVTGFNSRFTQLRTEEADTFSKMIKKRHFKRSCLKSFN